MPSPFPNMDPYLEHPDEWPSVHARLITYLADDLARKLPRGYFARVGERVFIATPPKTMYPDVLVSKPKQKGKKPPRRSGAVLEADPPLVIDFPDTEIREVYLEIVHTTRPGVPVTVLEILSPANKRTGQEGRTKYLEKQKHLLNSPTHLVEIDLLRAGEHTVAVPEESMPGEPWDYVVCLHRGDSGGRFHVWPAPLPARLPRFSVPLLDQDADVVVDLQSLVDHCYDASEVEYWLDYRQACPPPLTAEQAAWIDQLLRRKKLRK